MLRATNGVSPTLEMHRHASLEIELVATAIHNAEQAQREGLMLAWWTRNLPPHAFECWSRTDP